MTGTIHSAISLVHVRFELGKTAQSKYCRVTYIVIEMSTVDFVQEDIFLYFIVVLIISLYFKCRVPSTVSGWHFDQ